MEPIDVVVWVGAVIAIVGLAMIVVVFVLEQIAKWRPSGAGPLDAATGIAGVAEKLLEFIRKMTPRPYRAGVVTTVVGAAIMLGALYIDSRGDDDETPPTTTTETG